MSKNLIAFLLWYIATAEHYVIVLDAGSSATRFHIFQYEINETTCGPTPVIKVPQQQFEHKPGIAQLFNQKGDLKNYFDYLQNFTTLIPQSQWKDTELFFLGTAGFRDMNNDEAENVLDQIKDYLFK